LRYAYDVEFRSETRFFTVRTLEQLECFSQEFTSISAETVGLNPRFKRFPPRLDWHRVAKSYDVVLFLVNPNSQHSHQWYKDWRIASGCVLNHTVVERLLMRRDRV
jgi:hypothetical protein